MVMSVIVTGVSLTLYACANMARPGGGPMDEEPPVYVRSNPAENQTKISPKKIEIEFDEYIKLDKASEKVVVSPPQIGMPTVRSNGKKVTVELKDSLLPNTTYTIDFADAIQDNNEGNPLKDFVLSFSTGEHIDSLQVSGSVLNASDLEPVTGIYVGIQSNPEDSAFTTLPFTRVSKTNDRGRFTIRNVAPGAYKVYALKDINNDYRFDLPTEDIAFLDSIVIPSAEIKLHNDTIWKDSLTIDTIRVIEVPHFFPDNIVLRAFNEEKKNVYLEKTERLDKKKITFYFSAPEDSLPLIEGLNFDVTDWAVPEFSVNKDTVSFWIKDSLVYNLDTLRMTAGYSYTDTLQQLSYRTDTLNLIVRQLKKMPEKKKKGKNDADSIKIDFLPVTEQIPATLEIGQKPRLVFDEPIVSFDPESLWLELRQDSVFVLQAAEMIQDTLHPREYYLNAKLMPGAQYALTVDSAAFTGLYGRHTNSISKTFKIKTVEEYANLLLQINGVKDSAFVELLDKGDKPVAKAAVKNGQAKFIHMRPGTYYARIVLDKNGNGKYDTGNYEQKKQPEEVYYYPETLNLRANWDVQQEWDIYALPLIKQKPLEITKNKPKEPKKNDQQQKNNQNNQQSTYQVGGGIISGQSSGSTMQNTGR